MRHLTSYFAVILLLLTTWAYAGEPAKVRDRFKPYKRRIPNTETRRKVVEMEIDQITGTDNVSQIQYPETYIGINNPVPKIRSKDGLSFDPRKAATDHFLAKLVRLDANSQRKKIRQLIDACGLESSEFIHASVTGERLADASQVSDEVLTSDCLAKFPQ